jgi:hypothetical protein
METDPLFEPESAGDKGGHQAEETGKQTNSDRPGRDGHLPPLQLNNFVFYRIEGQINAQKKCHNSWLKTIKQEKSVCQDKLYDSYIFILKFFYTKITPFPWQQFTRFV